MGWGRGGGAAGPNSSYSCAKSSEACKSSPEITQSRFGSRFRDCRRSTDTHANVSGQTCFLMNRKSGNSQSPSSDGDTNHKSHWELRRKLLFSSEEFQSIRPVCNCSRIYGPFLSTAANRLLLSAAIK